MAGSPQAATPPKNTGVRQAEAMERLATAAERIAKALEAINAKTPNADGTTVAVQGAM